MIHYIAGTLMDRTDHSVIIDHQGMGFHILIPNSLLERMPSIGEEVKIYTYFHVKEDSMQLFGFATKQDKELFEQLITVSGIGPKGGLSIMGCLSSDDIRFAILSDDAKTISQAPGIGAKTAKKLILELKDKIDINEAVSLDPESPSTQTDDGIFACSNTNHGIQTEAVEALTALGYSSAEAMKAVKGVEITQQMTVEELLKLSLKNI